MAFHRFPYSNYHDLNLDWIIEKFEEWGSQWAEVKKAYEDFNADLTEIYRSLERLEQTDIQFSYQLTNLTGEYANLDNRLTALLTALDGAFNTIDAALTDLNARVEDIETEATFYMYSPFTGEYVPLEEVIMELAQFHLADALTATEYDTLDLTAAYYDGKQLTAIQYDASGKTLLP